MFFFQIWLGVPKKMWCHSPEGRSYSKSRTRCCVFHWSDYLCNPTAGHVEVTPKKRKIHNVQHDSWTAEHAVKSPDKLSPAKGNMHKQTINVCHSTCWELRLESWFQKHPTSYTGSIGSWKYIIHVCKKQYIIVNCWFGLVVWDSRGIHK